MLKEIFSQNLENCIATTKAGRYKCVSESKEKLVKLQRADGGYLGTQRRRRTWRPTKSFGELAASRDPKMSEWGNPKVLPVESIDR